ncbi:testicular spindle-associated protein SHCBP1L [Oncorhynchus tshawytscha]|uniref:Testicular spindle-associated protein SHCBP1L n=1 Tax=Oncorhynchus tshawytscha TaxID=74940 RepID=A0A8C8D7X4_ONCTS|nr:testicular spindle-associated protein SHCBP1L [Oncorhynchus tshawytscha]
MATCAPDPLFPLEDFHDETAQKASKEHFKIPVSSEMAHEKAQSHTSTIPNSEVPSYNDGSTLFSAADAPQIVRNKVPMRRKLLAPNPDSEEPFDAKEAQVLPQIFISNKTYTYDERVALFCDHIIGQCSAEDADEAISFYIIEKLASKRSWTAVWKTSPEVLLVNCDIGDLPFVGVLVDVNCTPCEGKSLPLRVSISVAEPYSSNIANLPRELVEDVLREHDYSVPILDVYPIQGMGADVDNIAEYLEHARFFYDFLWRDWDDEEECDEYAGLIEKRIQLYYDIQDGTIPGPISERYRKTLEEYRSKRLDLTKFQTKIRGEALPGEAVECWKKYYEMSMLCGLLKFWEDLRLRSHGPFYPRIYKRRKGQRTSGRIVTHIVAQIMTTDMIKNFSADTLIQQHDSLSAALDSCFSGDTVVVFPGEYHAVALASLTDDITIKGEGERKEVLFYSDPSHDNFVASKASKVMLMNLTLVQHGTCDGIVVVESGQLTLDNCVLKCQGTGVCVLTGASLVMKNCEISGAKGAGVELYPGSIAELHRNEIHHCSNQLAKDSKGSQGGINLKVLPQPQLKLTDNHIHDNHGYGVTILVPDNLYKASEDLEQTASGDKNETDYLSKALQKLSLEITTNKLESNTKGDIGLLRKMWVNS